MNGKRAEKGAGKRSEQRQFSTSLNNSKKGGRGGRRAELSFSYKGQLENGDVTPTSG